MKGFVTVNDFTLKKVKASSTLTAWLPTCNACGMNFAVETDISFLKKEHTEEDCKEFILKKIQDG